MGWIFQARTQHITAAAAHTRKLFAPHIESENAICYFVIFRLLYKLRRNFRIYIVLIAHCNFHCEHRHQTNMLIIKANISIALIIPNNKQSNASKQINKQTKHKAKPPNMFKQFFFRSPFLHSTLPQCHKQFHFLLIPLFRFGIFAPTHFVSMYQIAIQSLKLYFSCHKFDGVHVSVFLSFLEVFLLLLLLFQNVNCSFAFMCANWLLHM